MRKHFDIPGFFDRVFHWMAWLRIVISPTLAFAFIGAFVFLYFRGDLGIVLWILTTLLGVVLGVLWANRISRTMSPVYFMSQVIASPELDDKSLFKRLDREEMENRKADE